MHACAFVLLVIIRSTQFSGIRIHRLQTPLRKAQGWMSLALQPASLPTSSRLTVRGDAAVGISKLPHPDVALACFAVCAMRLSMQAMVRGGKLIITWWGLVTVEKCLGFIYTSCCLGITRLKIGQTAYN